MKKSTLLNQPLSAVIAGMGHTDGLVIADAGLPIPAGPERIDLAVKEGVPGFLDVLAATLDELKVEKAVIARETGERSADLHAELVALLGEDVEIEYVWHEKLKQRSAAAKAIVRTGEFTPYANVILYSGVVF